MSKKRRFPECRWIQRRAKWGQNSGIGRRVIFPCSKIDHFFLISFSSLPSSALHCIPKWKDWSAPFTHETIHSASGRSILFISSLMLSQPRRAIRPNTQDSGVKRIFRVYPIRMAHLKTTYVLDHLRHLRHLGHLRHLRHLDISRFQVHRSEN